MKGDEILINFFYRKLAGTVDFIAEGPEIEKLLTICAGLGTEIKKPQKIDTYKLKGTVFAKNYKKIRIPARKNGIRLHLTRKKGLCFFVKRNKNKIGILAGIIFIYFSILVMNNFIWEINVYGNKEIPSERIIESAEKMGLAYGSLKKSHNVQDMEWFIIRDVEGLAAVEINIQGTCANISVREFLKEPEMKSDDDVPVNLIASRYGVIRKIDVFDGQKTVSVGDAVMKGELLVSAVYEDSHSKLTLKHARANIIAETDYTIKVEFPFEQKIRKQGSVKKSVKEISIFGANFTFGSSKGCEDLFFETEEKELYFLWLKLPIKVMITRFFDVKELSITYNFEQGRDGAFQLLKQKEAEEMAGMEILSRSVAEKVKDNRYILTAEYICLMNIAEEQPIESDVPWENTDDMS